ncbi:hypothetical protein QL285_090389 [Trifolium repens]|nr:hypothetical protein QL285_090389 [Trifolium repens]
MEVPTKRRAVKLVKEVDKKQKLEGTEAGREVDEKQKVESTKAKKTVAKKKKVESTKAKSIFAWKEKEESSEEEYAKIIEPMDDLVDYTDYYTSSEEELTASGARFVSIVRKG